MQNRLEPIEVRSRIACFIFLCMRLSIPSMASLVPTCSGRVRFSDFVLLYFKVSEGLVALLTSEDLPPLALFSPWLDFS